jgi:hypothetical protein
MADYVQSEPNTDQMEANVISVIDLYRDDSQTAIKVSLVE